MKRCIAAYLAVSAAVTVGTVQESPKLRQGHAQTPEAAKMELEHFREPYRDIDGWELNIGDLCELGSQLRPHVVWFGEPVPLIMNAAEMCNIADIMIIIGTSLQVYPAAGLANYAPMSIPKYIIDPKAVEASYIHNLSIIQKNAGEGVPELVDKLLMSV